MILHLFKAKFKDTINAIASYSVIHKPFNILNKNKRKMTYYDTCLFYLIDIDTQFFSNHFFFLYSTVSFLCTNILIKMSDLTMHHFQLLRNHLVQWIYLLLERIIMSPSTFTCHLIYSIEIERGQQLRVTFLIVLLTRYTTNTHNACMLPILPHFNACVIVIVLL